MSIVICTWHSNNTPTSNTIHGITWHEQQHKNYECKPLVTSSANNSHSWWCHSKNSNISQQSDPPSSSCKKYFNIHHTLPHMLKATYLDVPADQILRTLCIRTQQSGQLLTRQEVKNTKRKKRLANCCNNIATPQVQVQHKMGMSGNKYLWNSLQYIHKTLFQINYSPRNFSFSLSFVNKEKFLTH